MLVFSCGLAEYPASNTTTAENKPAYNIYLTEMPKMEEIMTILRQGTQTSKIMSSIRHRTSFLTVETVQRVWSKISTQRIQSDAVGAPTPGLRA